VIAGRAQNDSVGQCELRNEIAGGIGAFGIVRLVHGELQRRTADESSARPGAIRSIEHMLHRLFRGRTWPQRAADRNDIG